MNKYIIFLLVLLIIPIVFGIDECESMIEPDTIPCTITSPYEFTPPCNSYLTLIYNSTPALVSTHTYSDYGSTGLCNFTWNITKEGTYYINSTDGSTAVYIVSHKYSNYYLYITSLIIFVVLLVIGYQLNQHIYLILAGMVSCVMALYMFNSGFPNLTNEFLRNGIVIILSGIGLYYIITPSVDYWQTEVI